MRAFFAISLIVATLVGSTIAIFDDENCWEFCFQVVGTPHVRFQPIYNEFYKMGMEARKLKNFYSVNGTAFLIDSTLDDYHNEDANDDLTDSTEYGDNIFLFQRRLASIVHYMLGNDEEYNPAYINQFDEDNAWTCNGHGCLDTCEFDDIIFNYLEDVEMSPSSHEDGNTEAACELAYYIMRTYSNDGPGDGLSGNFACPSSTRNEMAIVFANSDLHSHVRHPHRVSPCREHFKTRMVVGTHSVDFKDMNQFDSNDVRSIYIEDNVYTMEAAKTLQECMKKTCCNNSVSSDSYDHCECWITDDHFGKDINSYDDHDHHDNDCYTGF